MICVCCLCVKEMRVNDDDNDKFNDNKKEKNDEKKWNKLE